MARTKSTESRIKELEIENAKLAEELRIARLEAENERMRREISELQSEKYGKWFPYNPYSPYSPNIVWC